MADSAGALYMDYNATTPLAAEVAADISESLLLHWANPSSTHEPGCSARRVLEEARGHVAAAIGGRPEHVIFTSGGTEANNMVICGAVAFYRTTSRTGTPHVITSTVEHDAVEAPIAELERRHLCSVTRLSCRSGGGVSVPELRDALTPDTCLVSVMHANNETGVVNDIAAIGRFLRASPYRHQIWFHTDSAQTVGKLPVDVTELGADFVTVVGHKLYGPRIAALWVSPLGLTRSADGGGACVTLLRGGGQEGGLRAGTENTAMARGLGTACRLVTQRLEQDRRHMERLRDMLEQRLLESGVAERINFRDCARLPNTCSAVLSGGRSGRHVLRHCRRLLASVGSACHETACHEVTSGETESGECQGQGARGPAAYGAGEGPGARAEAADSCTIAPEPSEGPPITGVSAVLLRSGVSPEHARRTVRLSVGRDTSEQDVQEAVLDLKQALAAAARDQDQG